MSLDGAVDVSEAFDGLQAPITGERTSGSYVNGRWVEDTVVVLAFNGVVQNAEPDDMLVLEEGQRTKEAIKIHTIFELIPQIEDTTTGDEITYKGNTWLVVNAAHRYIGNYHKIIAVRQ